MDTRRHEELLDLLLMRLAQAEAAGAQTLHDFRSLLGDVPDIPLGWYHEAFEDLQSRGFLHRASGASFGGPFGRLSSEGPSS